MKLWGALSAAALGWYDILRGREGWQAHFSFTAGGLAKALVVFFFCAFLSIVIASIQTGMPGAIGVAMNLAVQALALVALGIGSIGTKLAVKSEGPVLGLLVPGVYGLTLYLIAGSILAAISIETVAIVLLALVAMLYRLGRMAGPWTLGVSLAFAVLTVVLLVGMPLTLYMLTNSAGSPI